MMKPDDIERLLAEQPIPASPEAAKRQAINAALNAYRANPALNPNSAEIKNSKNSQGFWSRLRLTRETHPLRNFSMTTIFKTWQQNQKVWLGGLATSCAVVLGFVLMQPLPKHSPVEEGALPEQLQESKAAIGLVEPAVVLLDRIEAETAAPAAPQRQLPKTAIAEPKSLAMATTALKNKKEMAEVQREAFAVKPSPSDAMVAVKDEGDRNRFSHTTENAVKQVLAEPVSTFSIDVDTAAYSFVRRQLNNGVLPPEDAVRVEEIINYFDYQYPTSKDSAVPFSTAVSVVDSPWRTGNKLVHIAIKGYDHSAMAQPDSNLVFLLDVSGSMASPDKLPLVKQSMGLLLDTLKPTDTVAIVVYAGAAGTVLEPTAVKEKGKIFDALTRLEAGGSTAGSQGLVLAYELAARHFKKDAVNRIMLATDGDFNVGVTQDQRLEDYVASQRDKGIFLSVLGFGDGNYQDQLMQTLAQNGNGVAAYIDTLSEAQKVLVDQATSMLFPIAKDVKIQVEFNPATVSEYRLIGFETRALNREDFNNDKVDAGDIGAGHRVTAIYEITPKGANSGLLDTSRYQTAKTDHVGTANEYGFLKLRYKLPTEETSQLITTPIPAKNVIANSVVDGKTTMQNEVNFSIAAAAFAQKLRGSHYLGDYSFDDIIALAQQNKGDDAYGYRTEFIQLVRKAKLAKAM